MVEAKEQEIKEVDPRLIAEFEGFIRKIYYKQLVDASNKGEALVIDFKDLDEYNSEIAEILLRKPDDFFQIAERSIGLIELQSKVRIRVKNLPTSVNIRDLRSAHLDKFICVEGTVRKASEIRPEILETLWECPECGTILTEERKGGFVFPPRWCDCGNKRGFKQSEKKMVDTRWIVIEEPFELTEGEKPSQVTILLTQDLVNQIGRRISDPGNRLKITGVLKDIPKLKMYSAKLDFYLDANCVEPTEIGWQGIEISKEDEDEIKRLAKDDTIYKKFVASLAPTLYGMEEIKEAIILQMFSGVRQKLKDGSSLRGEIHVLLVGDPASGKSQLMKLVPQIVPRGKYVSGKGTSTAGLTATVTKDEQFMGGWVLEAGAMVLAHRGLLSVDEFEKMAPEDQVAMHEALEQGTVSIAKASIVATLPAQTSVLAGGNPKFSRFDPYLPISKQITIADTLLTRFDLKFILKDIPNSEQDKKVIDHIVSSREEDYEGAKPFFERSFVRKYIAYAKDKCKPTLSKEAAKMLKKFYIETRKQAEGGNVPIPVTLRQFEALIRLSEASAKVQLCPEVRKEDAQRAIRLMKFSLKELGMDPNTGMIDIDRSEGLTTSSERSNIRVILDIINDLSKIKKEISIFDIEQAAKKEGIENIDELIDKLKREGMLFEPSPGHVQKV